MDRAVKIALIVVAVLLWAISASAQTAVDLPQVKSKGLCQGASTNGVLTCAANGVTAGDVLYVIVQVNSGTLGPTLTETAQSTTVNLLNTASYWGASAQKCHSTTPILCLTANTLTATSGGNYTLSSNDGGGAGDTTAQTIAYVELSNVTSATPDVFSTGKINTTSSTSWGASTVTTSGASVTDLLISWNGAPGTVASLVIPNNFKPWTGQETELTSPSGLLSSFVSGYFHLYPGPTLTSGTSSANLGIVAAFKSAVQSSIVGSVSLVGTDNIGAATTQVPTMPASQAMPNGCVSAGVPAACCTGNATGPTCFNTIALQFCVTADATINTTCTGGGLTWTRALNANDGGNNTLCTGAAAPAPCCTGAGTGTCIDYDILFLAPWIPGSTAPTCTFTGTIAGVSGVDFTNSVGGGAGTFDGTPSANHGSGTAVTSPSDAGSKAGDITLFPSCTLGVATNPFATMNPLNANVAAGGVSDSSTTSLEYTFYPTTATGTLPVNNATITSAPWQSGEVLLSATTPTPTATATPKGCDGATLGREKGLGLRSCD